MELWSQMLCCLSNIGVVLTQLPEGLEESSSFMPVCCIYISRKYRLGTGFRKARSHCWRKAPGARDQRSKPAIGKAGPETPATKRVQWALSQHVCIGGQSPKAVAVELTGSSEGEIGLLGDHSV